MKIFETKGLMETGRLVITILLMVFTGECLGQEKPQSVTVNLELMQESDRSLDQVKEELLRDARVEAVQRVTGLNIKSFDAQAETESIEENDAAYFQTFRRLMRINVEGRIVGENTPEYYVEGNMVGITYTCKVQKLDKDYDQYFKVDISSNKKAYTVGEPIEFEVTTTKDAYITLFSIKEDNSVAMFFPNAYLQENYVKSDELRLIPNEKERRIIDFTAQTEGNQEVYSELIFAVATKEKYEFEKLAEELSYKNNWITLNKWLMDLERDQWTEDFAQIVIYDN
ncbi:MULTISPECIES: DUF4384 domain-containing protein [Gracilimonas]|uniref:DUF4384 domain-containing protein n=1 Tax=Gracilimonas sediminicola TaxID=2952158 RepID=A0A9X2L1L9_9BACT|nr:DUF4384 domain-containing protein [Gracilimonas sediminicola]MCP9290640.1 DUF4384 domain-containing protein [Gracilimonas sediminicola]